MKFGQHLPRKKKNSQSNLIMRYLVHLCISPSRFLIFCCSLMPTRGEISFSFDRGVISCSKLPMENLNGTLSAPDARAMRKLNGAISRTIHYTFRNHDLLLEALTHASLRKSRENPTQRNTNQRLEFLGDSVLTMLVTITLFKMFPNEEEGALAMRRRALVCGSTIADVAKQIRLGDFLQMAESERNSGGAQNLNNLEDAVEALIGAIYLDGGFEEVETFVERHWRKLAESMREFDPPQDFRSSLQEWVQKRGLPLPEYRIIKQSGLQHDPEFTVSLSVQNYHTVTAVGSSIKSAQQSAAKLMLDRIEIDSV